MMFWLVFWYLYKEFGGGVDLLMNPQARAKREQIRGVERNKRHVRTVNNPNITFTPTATPPTKNKFNIDVEAWKQPLPDIKLIRTDTTLDLSQKAEKMVSADSHLLLF